MELLISHIQLTGSPEINMIRLQLALEILPPENREAITLHYIEGLSRKEIAAKTGWTYSKVHNRITRGITLLKWKMNPGYFESMNTVSLRVCASAKEPI